MYGVGKKIGLKVVKVIKEAESAKEPDIRPKFREMIEEIKKGKYEGIIAWHPDRLARNMKDAGEIIDLLDKQIIKDLHFVSFTFQNNTAGKMLLGIAFVFRLAPWIESGIVSMIPNPADFDYELRKNTWEMFQSLFLTFLDTDLT